MWPAPIWTRTVADPSRRLRYRLYEPSDGLAGAPVGRIGSARAPDGSLWFVRGGGLTVVDPSRLDDVRPPPVVQVEAVVANERRLAPSAGTAFDSGTRRLQIAYTAVTLTSPHRLRFRYRLEGFDADWVVAGSRRTAFYTNLPPGSYRFRVEAQLEDGGSDASSAVWDFSVKPAFYQTPWFAALGLVAGASAVWGAWRLRLRFVRRQFAAVLSERMRLSRELHDTLLQSLVGVALQVQAVAHELAPDAPIRRRLTEIRRRVEAHIRETRQAIWDMRSPQLEARALGDALDESGREAVVGTDVRFSSQVTGAPRRCPADLETHLLRIGREAMANAARHAHASAIQVALDYAPEPSRSASWTTAPASCPMRRPPVTPITTACPRCASASSSWADDSRWSADLDGARVSRWWCRRPGRPRRCCHEGAYSRAVRGRPSTRSRGHRAHHFRHSPTWRSSARRPRVKRPLPSSSVIGRTSR